MTDQAANLARCKAAFHEVDQTLGRALGYPEYAPDMGAPEGDVCTGDHVPETLAMEAAGKIRELTAERDRLRVALANIREAVRSEELTDGASRAAVGSLARSVEPLSDETVRIGQRLSDRITEMSRAAAEAKFGPMGFPGTRDDG
jgi:hypothetical protein